MKYSITIILSLVLFVGTFAQDSLSFKQVDTTTYQSYLHKDWKSVIKVGNQALQQNIDYYFLRMRLGIAYYERKNFRKSIIHFTKAMQMSPDEVVATEYLYFAYKAIGNDIQAMRTLNQSHTKFSQKQLNKQTIFQDVYSFYSTRIYDADQLEGANLLAYQDEIQARGKPIYTNQYIPKTYQNFQLGTTVRFSPSWRLGISYQYFKTSSEQYILDPFQKITEDSKVIQKQWNINNTLALGNKIQASVFLSYLSQKYNYIYPNTSVFPANYETVSNASNKNLLLGIALSRQQTYFDISLSASVMTATDPSNQFDLGLSIYPFGNRKLSLESRISSLLADTTGRHLIVSEELSYSPHERILLSLSGNWGDMRNWNTNNGYNVYNGIYNLSALYQAKLTVRVVKKLYFKLFYEYMENSSNIWSKSLFTSDENDIPQVITNNKFYTHSIIGGLVWEF